MRTSPIAGPPTHRTVQQDQVRADVHARRIGTLRTNFRCASSIVRHGQHVCHVLCQGFELARHTVEGRATCKHEQPGGRLGLVVTSHVPHSVKGSLCGVLGLHRLGRECMGRCGRNVADARLPFVTQNSAGCAKLTVCLCSAASWQQNRHSFHCIYSCSYATPCDYCPGTASSA